MQEEITNTADLQVLNLLRLTRNKTNHLINIRNNHILSQHSILLTINIY